MIPSKAQKFIDDRITQDRALRRTSWAGTETLVLAYPRGESGRSMLPDRDEFITAMSEPRDGETLSEMSNKLFDLFDQIIRAMPRASESAQQTIAANVSIIEEPDYLVHLSGDDRDKVNYVSALIGNKIFTTRSRGEYEITDLDEKAHVFIAIDDNGDEAQQLRSDFLGIDDFTSLERLEGQRLRDEIPELNKTVQTLALKYPNQVDLLEAELHFRTERKDAAKGWTKKLNEMPSTDRDRFMNVELETPDDEKLVEENTDLNTCRVRFNLNSNSEIESISILTDAYDIDQHGREPKKCMMIVCHDKANG